MIYATRGELHRDDLSRNSVCSLSKLFSERGTVKIVRIKTSEPWGGCVIGAKDSRAVIYAETIKILSTVVRE